ncbi:hypothetical protein [Actinomadura rugatobispora]|uniref:VWA domain-containing protein n=1 Tax=Actinomadura rugatobispora TaxID=1994 RepID=A0ABW1ADD0_9ACTN|nr:hypothetical protein GCM10010200_079360 [Actinomadura rugatobispora]
MPYQAEISRARPAFFVFLVDQSGSMDGFTRDGKIKKDVVAESLNRLLHQLINRCVVEKGIRNYFKIAVIGYGAGDRPGSVLQGGLAGFDFVTTSELDENKLGMDVIEEQYPDGNGGYVQRRRKVPMWVRPVAEGRTPMCAAFTKAYGLLDRWVSENYDHFPPVVLNLSDGWATDGDPTGIGKKIASLGTNDGQVLLFNLHLSSEESAFGNAGRPIVFPESPAGLDAKAATMFEISSPLPDRMLGYAAEHNISARAGARGFIHNAGADLVIKFLQIGTRNVPGGKGP